MATTVTFGGNGKLIVGEDKKLELHVLDEDGVPIDVSEWSLPAKFMVRKKDASEVLLLEKDTEVVGEYNVDPEVNTQRLRVTLTDDDTNDVSDGKAATLRHGWKRMDPGSETVFCRGPFVLEKSTVP